MEDIHGIYINAGFSLALVKKLKFTPFARNLSYLAVVKLWKKQALWVCFSSNTHFNFLLHLIKVTAFLERFYVCRFYVCGFAMNLKLFWQYNQLLSYLADHYCWINWSGSATVLNGNAIFSLCLSIVLNILPSFRLCLALMTFSDISHYYHS